MTSINSHDSSIQNTKRFMKVLQKFPMLYAKEGNWIKKWVEVKHTMTQMKHGCIYGIL